MFTKAAWAPSVVNATIPSVGPDGHSTTRAKRHSRSLASIVAWTARNATKANQARI